MKYVGKMVAFRYAGVEMLGVVWHDPGCVGYKGRHLLRVRVLHFVNHPTQPVPEFWQYVELPLSRVTVVEPA